jgi:hypothetical protein
MMLECQIWSSSKGNYRWEGVMMMDDDCDVRLDGQRT